MKSFDQLKKAVINKTHVALLNPTYSLPAILFRNCITYEPKKGTLVHIKQIQKQQQNRNLCCTYIVKFLSIIYSLLQRNQRHKYVNVYAITVKFKANIITRSQTATIIALVLLNLGSIYYLLLLFNLLFKLFYMLFNIHILRDKKKKSKLQRECFILSKILLNPKWHNFKYK